MSEQSEAWGEEFGDNYNKRNRVDWRRRIAFWSLVLERTGARSILEVGCNAGWNMTAIKKSAPWTRVAGSDVNHEALRLATAAGLEVWPEDITAHEGMGEGLYELVFTAGVLIHIREPELEKAMRAIVRKSNHWVLAIEYGSDYVEEIIYRGQPNMLWKRPFGKMYEAMGLKLAAQPYVLTPEQGFDNCTVYLLEKP